MRVGDKDVSQTVNRDTHRKVQRDAAGVDYGSGAAGYLEDAGVAGVGDVDRAANVHGRALGGVQSIGRGGHARGGLSWRSELYDLRQAGYRNVYVAGIIHSEIGGLNNANRQQRRCAACRQCDDAVVISIRDVDVPGEVNGDPIWTAHRHAIEQRAGTD